MTKHLRLLMLALLALVCMGGYSQEVTFDFTDYKGNPWKLPTSYSKEEATFTNGDYSIKLTPGINKGFMLLSTKGSVGTIQMGNQNAALALPIFNFDVEKIVVVGNAAVGNKSVTQNIFVDNVSVSTETKGSASTNQYLISEKYQKSGNIYVLKVTNSYLTHINKIQIYKKQDSGKADPEIAFKETEKTVELKEVAMELSTLINNPHSLPVNYTSSNAKVAEVSEGVIYMKKTGKVDITAKFAGNDTYNAAEKTLALTIVDNRADAGIHFEKDSYTADINKDEFSGAVLVNPNSLKVTYSINPNDETALIDEESGLVTYTKGTEASYEVTATFAGNDTHKPATATYTLNVTDPNYEVKTVTFDVTVDKGTTTGTEADAMNKGGVYVTSKSAALGRDDEYRLYGGSTHTFSVKTGKITKIEFVGNSQKYPLVNLKLKEENGTFSATALAATWTGNSDNVVFTTEAQARATKITVTVKVPVAKDVALDEEKDNVVEAAENANVTLKRTLYADGGWNTLCLPFTLTDAQAKAAFGDDVELRTLESVSGNTLTFASATGITAGVPYLIKVSKVAGDNTYTFTGVTTIAVKEEMDFGSSGKKNNVEFVGIYSPADVSELATAGKENALFLGAANKFYKAKAGTTMNAFRAFFLVPASTDTQALRAVIDGTTTGIDDLNIDTVKADGRVYNLNGQCVGYSLEGLKAGIYIQNGKKVIKK